MQVIFSCTMYPTLPVTVFPSFLMVGFTTFFTQLPVLSLIYNRDVTPKMANDYPELYKELTKARVLTFKTFLIWTLISIYEGKSEARMISFLSWAKSFCRFNLFLRVFTLGEFVFAVVSISPHSPSYIRNTTFCFCAEVILTVHKVIYDI